MSSKSSETAYQAFLTFLNAVARRDKATAKELFNNNITGFGTGEDETVTNLEQAFFMLDREHEQVPNPTRVKVELLASRAVSHSLCLLMALVTHEIMFAEKWEKYGPARYSALLEKNNSGWKILHLHISEPWKAQEDGEAYPLMQLEEKNRLLNEAIAEKTRELRAALTAMEAMATTDELTNAYNRRKFREIANHEISRAHRYRNTLSLIILDLDNFKEINDTYGHLTGDRVLQQIVQVIRPALREVDALARWRGDEFIILLPEQSLERTVVVAQRIKTVVGEHDFGISFPIRMSMGVAQYWINEGFEGWLKRADELLYQAKHAGRDRVVWAKSLSI
jgi:diguanylate cyclase (GGDEF)-like protein